MTNTGAAVEKAALEYQHQGFNVIPIHSFNDPKEKGKVKKVAAIKWEKYKTTRVTQTTILTEFKLHFEEGCGIAIITGKISNLIVVDIDNQEALNKIKPYLPADLKAPIVKTPGGGWHIYFQHREGLKTTAALGRIVGLDIRSDGGYVVAPPSLYPNGVPYRFVGGFDD